MLEPKLLVIILDVPSSRPPPPPQKPSLRPHPPLVWLLGGLWGCGSLAALGTLSGFEVWFSQVF